MFLNNYGQSLVHAVVQIFSSVYQMFDPLYQNFQATVSVYRECGGETANTGRDAVRDEACQTLQPHKNLTDRTVTRVDNRSSNRIHQRPIRQIYVRLRNFAVDKRQSEIIKRCTTVREEHADHHETSAELRVSDHDRSIAVMSRVHPVVLNVFETDADITFAINQR